ncbi:recombinase family protein [Bradyrhizobium sp. USDA 4353]
MKVAFSYIRFSSPEQARGDSYRRQSERAAEWAKKNGYRIAKTWRDLGVSGYRGANAKAGAFAEFLRDVAANQLPKDSVLILENIDRMSRQEPEDALPVFLGIIRAGIGILTLSDERLYTRETMRQDRMMLFGTLMSMIRANEESSLKGQRVAAAWARKRQAARAQSIPLTDRVPGWLVISRDESGRRIFSENPERADIVRRIFLETEQGLGRRTIVKRLNREGKLSFLSEKGWQTSSVAKIVATRTVLGEYQPSRRDADGKRVPDGQPILNYYPAVVDEGLYLRANRAVTSRRKNAGGRPSREEANLLRGIAYCGVCKRRMAFLNKGDPPKGGHYFVCSAAYREDKCDNKRLWNAKNVDGWLMHQVSPTKVLATFEPVEKQPGMSVQDYDLLIADLTAKKRRAINILLDNEDSVLAPDLKWEAESLTEQIQEKKQLREALAKAERERPHLPTAQENLALVADLAAKLANATDAERTGLRRSFAQQLRVAYFRIVFRPHSIAGLIEVPAKPKPYRLGPISVNRNFETHVINEVEHFFVPHRFFGDDPEELAGLGGGTGIITPRSGLSGR